MDSRDYNYYYYNLNCFNQPQASPNQNQAFHHHWQGSFIPPIAATERSPSPSTSSEGNETACSSTRKSYDRWSDDEQKYLIELWAEDLTGRRECQELSRLTHFWKCDRKKNFHRNLIWIFFLENTLEKYANFLSATWALTPWEARVYAAMRLVITWNLHSQVILNKKQKYKHKYLLFLSSKKWR